MNDQTIERVTNAYPAGFGVEKYLLALLQIGEFIKIGLYNAGAGFYYGHFAGTLLPYPVYQDCWLPRGISTSI